MKTFKIGDTIKFRVRTDGDPATDNPTATVYDETDTAGPTPLTIGSGLTQTGTKQIVVGSFVPDANGVWSVNVEDDTGMDLVKQFIVGDYSLEAIGGLTATVESKIDSQDTVLASILTGLGNGRGHFG